MGYRFVCALLPWAAEPIVGLGALWCVTGACSTRPSALDQVQSGHDASVCSGPNSEFMSPGSKSDAGGNQQQIPCGGWSQTNDQSWVVEVVAAVNADLVSPRPDSSQSTWARMSGALEAQLSRLNGLHAFGLIGYSSDSGCPVLEVKVPAAPLEAQQRAALHVALQELTTLGETLPEAPLHGAVPLTLNEFARQAQNVRFEQAEHILLLLAGDVGANPEVCGADVAPNFSEQVEALWNDVSAEIRPTLVVVAVPDDAAAATALASWPLPPAGAIIDCNDLDACVGANGSGGTFEDTIEYWLAPNYVGAPDVSCDFALAAEVDSGVLLSIELTVTPFEGEAERSFAPQTQDCSPGVVSWITDGERVTLCPELCDQLKSGLVLPGAHTEVEYYCSRKE